MDERNLQLSETQAYLAMFAFLEAHFVRTRSDDIGALLGSMALMADGTPADPALAGDWKQALAAVLSGQVNAAFDLVRDDPKSAA